MCACCRAGTCPASRCVVRASRAAGPCVRGASSASVLTSATSSSASECTVPGHLRVYLVTRDTLLVVRVRVLPVSVTVHTSVTAATVRARVTCPRVSTTNYYLSVQPYSRGKILMFTASLIIGVLFVLVIYSGNIDEFSLPSK